MATSAIPKQITNALEQIILANPPEGVQGNPRFGTSGGNGFTVSFHQHGVGWVPFGRPIPYDHINTLRRQTPSFEGAAELMWGFINGDDHGIAPEIRQQVQDAMREFVPAVVDAVKEAVPQMIQETLSDLGLWSAEPAPFEESAPEPSEPAALDEDGNPVKPETTEPAAETRKKTTRKKTASKAGGE